MSSWSINAQLVSTARPVAPLSCTVIYNISWKVSKDGQGKGT